MPSTVPAGRPDLSGTATGPSARPSTSRYQAFTRHARVTLKLLRPSAYATNFMSGLFVWNMRGGKGKGQANRDLLSKNNTSPYEAQTQKLANLAPLLSRQQKADAARQRRRERKAQASQPDRTLPKASRRAFGGNPAAGDKPLRVRKADGKSNPVLNLLSATTCRQVRRRRTGKADLHAVLSDMPKLPAPRNPMTATPVDTGTGVGVGSGDNVLATGMRGHDGATQEFPLPQAGADWQMIPPHAETPVWRKAGLRGAHLEQQQEYEQLYALITQRFKAQSPPDMAAIEALHRDLLVLSSLEEGLQCGECEAIVNKLALASGHDPQLAHQILRELGTTYDVACGGVQAEAVSDATWRMALLLSRDAVGLELLKRLAICRIQSDGTPPATRNGKIELPRSLVELHQAWRDFLLAREWLEQAVREPSGNNVAAAKAAYDTAQGNWTQENSRWRKQEYKLAPRCDAYCNFLEAADAMCSGTSLTMKDVLTELPLALPGPADAPSVSALVDRDDTARQLAHRVMHAGRQTLQHYGAGDSQGPLASRLGRKGTLDYFIWNQGFRDDAPTSEFVRSMAQLMKTDKYADRAVKRMNGEASSYDPRPLFGMKKAPFLAMGGETHNFQSALAQADRANYDKSLLALAEYKVALIKDAAATQQLDPAQLAEYAVQLAVVALYKEKQVEMEAAYSAGKDDTQRPLMSGLDREQVRQHAVEKLRDLLEIQDGRQTVKPSLSAVPADKQRVEPVVAMPVTTAKREPDAEAMAALEAQLDKPLKLSRAQLETWLPALSEEARTVVREREGKDGVAPDSAKAMTYKELAMVKHFITLQWLERGGEFMSVASKAGIYRFMARAAEGMRNNSLTGTNGAELGVDVSVVVPVVPGVNLRPRVAATGTRTVTITQSRNLNGLSYTVSSGRGGAGEVGLEASLGADIGVAGVGAFIGASAGYEETRGKGVTVRFKTDVVQDENGKHSYESMEDTQLYDAEGKPVKLDASRVGMRRFFQFMEDFGEGKAAQAEPDESRLQGFMTGFAAEFLETSNLELTGTRQTSRSVQVTSRELIGARLGSEDARAFIGIGSEQQVRIQTKVLDETSQRAAANNAESELYGVVRGIAGVSLTPSVGTAQVKLPGVSVLSAQATPVESSVNVQIKQQMKKKQLDKYCTFQVMTVRSVEALRAVLGPDIDQWQQYSSGAPTLQKFLDEYSLKNKGDNSMFFQCIKNLREPAVIKIRNYDSQLNGLETELAMAREAGHDLRVRQLEVLIAHIRSQRNEVLQDDSNWKLYALSARQYIDRGDGNGIRFGVVLQKKNTKAITEEVEWFSWSFDTRAKEGRKMEERQLLAARVAQMEVPSEEKNAEAWRAGIHARLCQIYGLSKAAAPAA